MSLLEALRDGWGWTGIDFAEIHRVSPMGHLLLTDRDGCFHYLDTELWTIEAVGDVRAEAAHFAREKTQEVWQAVASVDAAREHLGGCPEGYVYSWKPHALIEGDYAYENLWICRLDELIRLTGDLARQTRDLPDGSQIRIRIVD